MLSWSMARTRAYISASQLCVVLPSPMHSVRITCDWCMSKIAAPALEEGVSRGLQTKEPSTYMFQVLGL